MGSRRPWATLLIAGAMVAACVEEERLPGERIPIRETSAIADEVVGEALALLPEAIQNDSWTHTGGSPLQNIENPALGADLELVWSARVGPPERPGVPKSEPVVADA